MVHQNTKTITGVSLIVLIVSLGVAIWLFLETQSRRTALEAAQVTFAQAQAHKLALKELLKTVTDTAPERAELTSRIVGKDSVIELLSLIETVGTEQGVKLTTDSLATSPMNDIFESLEVHLSAEGSYRSVIHTLSVLEQLPYQSSITAVNLNKNEQSTGEASWKATFTLKVTKFK